MIKNEREELLNLIKIWESAEMAYVQTVIRHPIGSRAEQSALREMEESRGRAMEKMYILRK